MGDDFVHLHVHSDKSLLDGLGTEEQFVERAVEIGSKALAFTDHGSLRGWWTASRACVAAGIRHVPGCELYVVADASVKGLTDEEKRMLVRDYPDAVERREARAKEEKAHRDRDHVTVWAMDEVGLRNLIKLTAWSWVNGFYHKPRVDPQRLVEYGEGLIVSGGCVGSGYVVSPLRRGNPEEAIRRARFMAEAFPGRFVIEVMPHVVEGPGTQAPLVRMATDLGVPVVATQDAHFPRREDYGAHEALLCVQTHTTLEDPDRFKLGPGYWLRSREEMEEAFRRGVPKLGAADVRRALDATVEVADRCGVCVTGEEAGSHVVAPALPDGVGSYEAWLIALCRDGLADRLGADYGEEYDRRLIYELRRICERGVAPYFVAVWDLRQWARTQGILCGPGRGSAAGCLVSYLLRITDLDPIQYDLSFDRFLAPGRSDLPDVDLDFDAERRDEVLGRLREQYGADCVAHIATHNTLKGRSILHDVGRVYGLPAFDLSAVTQMIGDKGGVETVGEALRETSPGRDFMEQYPGAAVSALRLEGQVRAVGVHAAGVVVADCPLDEIIPVETCTRGGERVRMVAYELHGVEGVGLLKLDVLGLRTLTLIRSALEMAGAVVEDIEPEHTDVMAAFSRGEFGGIFQFDTPAARRLCAGCEFSSLADVAIMTALNRPGPQQSGLADQYRARRANPLLIAPVHPVYDEVFAETFGVPIYQEQVVELARRMAGYSPVRADEFRRGIAKKAGLDDEEERFVAGAITQGVEGETARSVFRSIVGFAGYAFNRAHAYSYAMVACWCQWLRVRFPAAFFAAAMSVERDEQKRIALAGDARRMGVDVVPPDVQVSGTTFRFVRRPDGVSQIVGSLLDLDGIGPVAARAIERGAPYADLLDFYNRTAGAGHRVTSSTFGVLARATALRELSGNARVLARNARVVWAALRKGEVPVVDEVIPDYTEEQKARIIGAVWPPYIDGVRAREMDVVVSRLREGCPRREFHSPGILSEADPRAEFVVGRIDGMRVYEDPSGTVTRVSLVGIDGADVTLRVDEDVMQWAGSVVARGAYVVALSIVVQAGYACGEGFWSIDDLVSGGGDAVAAAVVNPLVTRPRDPWAVAERAYVGRRFAVEGMIVRVRDFADRTGRDMKSVGVLGTAGYVRPYVFAWRCKRRDVRMLQRGSAVNLGVERLDGGAVCVTDREIRRCSVRTMAAQ